MRNLASGVLIVCLAIGPASAFAQPRDSVIEQERREAEALNCSSDPDCASALKKAQQQQLREEARAEAIYQAKPAWQKLLGWLAIPAAFWALWTWAGKPRRGDTGDKPGQ